MANENAHQNMCDKHMTSHMDMQECLGPMLLFLTDLSCGGPKYVAWCCYDSKPLHKFRVHLVRVVEHLNCPHARAAE